MAGAGADVREVMSALVFACEAHANRRRKGVARELDVNHLSEVAEIVARTTGAAASASPAWRRRRPRRGS